jgi:PPIC-type PPIASE domain
MMRDFWVGCLLAGTLAWTQAKLATPAAPPNSPPAAGQQDQDDAPEKPPASAAGVAADAPVLTVKGLCAQPTLAAEADRAKSACQTVITRAQFETLADALRTAKDAQTRRHFAKAYPQFLVMAREAEQRGLDKQPRFEARLNFARLQILSQELMGQIQEEAARVPEADIEDYYQKNSRDFESVSVQRIVIPNRTQAKPQQPAAEQRKPGEDVMTKEAELLRTRAAAGEDFSKLQKQAYDAAGVSGNNSPNPDMGKMRRRGLPPAHASVFDLNPGQVSQVISDATGHYIYKLDWKGIEPLDAVRNEISNALRGQRQRKMVQDLQQPFTTEVNQEYFGADSSRESD